MPELPVYSPEMLAFLKTEPPIQCDDEEAWVLCGTTPTVSTNFSARLLLVVYLTVN